MRINKSLGVPICAIVLTALAFQLGGARQTPAPQTRAQPGTQPTYFIEHPDNVQPGLGIHSRLAALTNPFEGDKASIAEGAKLFIAYNCLDCHGAEGAGAMGPSLQDNRWHFGGTAGEVFQSIYEGRPDGMPSWGGRIRDEEIWRLVAYVRTLSTGHSVATENFTGKTIARSGH
jgi:cytochrome c oxidase cbb3-type subunit 3